MSKKLLAVVLAVFLMVSLVACGGDTPDTTEATSEAGAETAIGEEATPAATEGESSEEAITIRLFSELPDRTNGQGLIEQMLIDSYMAENPNVKIEVENLDQESYKVKFRAYAAGSDMPDIFTVWGQPSFINEVIEAGLLAELDQNDYADSGFIPGSLEGFSMDDKLYGLPRNTDIMGFYYNEAMFKENSWEVPATYEEMLTLCQKISDAGIMPVSMDGADKWPLSILYSDFVQKVHGKESGKLIQEAIENKDWSHPDLLKAAELMQESAQGQMFQNGFISADYGSSMNLFTNAQAAMFYMGSWEMSLANNQDIPAEVRENIRVFNMPIVEGGKGTADLLAAWNGGGYSVSANSPVKEESIKFLNYMMEEDNWNRLTWENNVCMSAQNFAQYQTGDETPVQKQFVELVSNASEIAGTPMNDLGSSEFKTFSEDTTQELMAGMITPQEFLDKLATMS